MAPPRIAIVLPVRFSVPDGRAVQTTSAELSMDGVRIRCLEPPPLDTEVEIRLYLPGNQIAELMGVVREVSTDKDMGFWAELIGAKENGRERVAALVNAHSSGGWRTPVPIAALHPRRLENQQRIPLPAGEEQLQKTTNLIESDLLNRRSFPRHRARFIVRFESVQEFVLQYAANISAGGVFVSTDFPPPMDSIITVVLQLPGSGQPVSARGQIVHRVTPEQAAASGTDAGAGVQFVDADDAFREGIDRAIDFILAEKLKDGGA